MSENPHYIWVRFLILYEWESSFFMSENLHSIWVKILILYDEWESSFFYEWESSFFMSENPHFLWVRILILSEWEWLEIFIVFSFPKFHSNSFIKVLYIISLLTPQFHLPTSSVSISHHPHFLVTSLPVPRLPSQPVSSPQNPISFSSQCLISRGYCMIYRGPGFFVVVWFGSAPTPSPRM
jgi:hypothetical protein